MPSDHAQQKTFTASELIQAYQGFLFDFDGVLVNTEKLHYKAYMRTMETFDLSPHASFEEYALAAHHSTGALADFFFQRAPELCSRVKDWQEVRLRKLAVYTEMLHHEPPELMPGVEKFLQELLEKGRILAVVTNSPSNDVREIRSNHPILQQIPTWITADDYEKSKPDPQPYLKALETLNLNASECVGFEDTIKGLTALKRAKIFALWHSAIQAIYPKMDLVADIPVISSFDELFAPAPTV